MSIAPTSPPAVMCLDPQGVVLFATGEAQRMCALWNEELKEKAGDPEAEFRRRRTRQSGVVASCPVLFASAAG